MTPKVHGNRRHYFKKTPIYVVWAMMKQRCLNPKSTSYPNYGARGIKVCKEWSFSAALFCEWALANGYKKGYELDRINNDGDYEPSNCRFVTIKENSRNRRTNVYVKYNNKNVLLYDLTKELNINYFSVWYRVNIGWDLEKAINTPIRKYIKK